MTIDPPPDHVVAAFGVSPALLCLRPVHGGQGTTFRAGGLAIKQCDDIERTEWVSSIIEGIQESGFRVARPVRAASGRFVADGWCATQWIDGTTAIEGRWHEAIDALQAFHHSLRAVPHSPLVHQMGNPYDRADTAIWGQWPKDMNIGPSAERLRRWLRPVTLPSQLVHGDPSEGNLLFASGQQPGIIDIAPYWHPADYAIAVLIADGIAWSGAPVDLLIHTESWPQMDQLLIRAVLFRLYVGFLFRGGIAAAERRASAYGPVIAAVERRLR